jgi:hypothetical protein
MFTSSCRPCKSDQVSLAKRNEGGWVFARPDGSPWEPAAFSLAFARFIKSSKLPHVRFDDLRHSFATLALASGADLQTVSRALGHESTAITSRIYLHAIESLNEGAAARIDAPQPCHPTALPIKNARIFGRFRITPTGIEPANRCPGRSPVEYRIVLSCTGFRVF